MLITSLHEVAKLEKGGQNEIAIAIIILLDLVAAALSRSSVLIH